MKVRIPGRERLIPPRNRTLIRNLITASCDLAMIESYGFGWKRLQRLHDRVWSITEEYTKAYGEDNTKEIASLLRHILSTHGIGYGDRKGSGGKVTVALEHDVMLMIYILAAVEVYGFGPARAHRIFQGSEDYVLYSNRVFEGRPSEVLTSIRSRIEAYGGTYMRWEELT